MDAREIKMGDKVSKVWRDYTVICSPVKDIFKAADDKGETVVLCIGEVEKFTQTAVGEDSRPFCAAAQI
jgi:hypothetical protein